MSETIDENYGTAPKHAAIYTQWTDQKGEARIDFEPELALAALLMNEVIFLNDHWWHKNLPDNVRKMFSVNVNCNDVFAWGCADAEECTYGELQEVYDHWHKDPSWGGAVWCIKKRGEMPQRPVEKRITDGGIWDLSSMMLKPNYYDGVGGVIARRKYEMYVSWAKQVGRKPFAFVAAWWDGWKEYVETNPEWNSPQWKAEDDAAIARWKQENGYMSVEP